MSRLRLWRALISLVAASVALSACAGAAGVAPAPPVSTTSPPITAPPVSVSTTAPPSVYGGTVVVGIGDVVSPRSLNPFITGPDAVALDLLTPALFARGFSTDPSSGRRIPDALAAVPSVAAGTLVDLGDGTQEVAFEVVDGARWADGALITARDLEFTYQTAADPALPIRPDIAATYAMVVPGSARADGRTLTLRMEAGTDPTDLFSVILPRHDVEGSDFAVDWNDRLWVAGGPFHVTDWQPGQFIELSRNEQYWKVTQAEAAPLPFLDRIIVRFFEPGDDLDPRLVRGLEQGGLDVAAFAQAEDRASELADAVAAGAVVESAGTGSWEHLNFQFGPANRNRDSENASLAFRRAVAAAIDRRSLAATRGTDVVESVLGRFVPGLGASPFDFELDRGLAAAYLAERSPPITVTATDDDPQALALGGEVVTMLRNAGFDAELQLEGAAMLFGPTLDNGSWDVGLWRFGARSGLGAAVDFVHLFDPDGLPFVGANYYRWGTIDSTVQDPATERYRNLMDRLDRAVGRQAIESLLIEAEQLLADQGVLIPLIVADETGVAFWPEAVEGVSVNPVDGPLWNSDVWRVPTESASTP